MESELEPNKPTSCTFTILRISVLTQIQPWEEWTARRSDSAEQGVLVYSWRLVVERNHGLWFLWYLLFGAHMVSHDNQLTLYDRHKL